MDFSYLELQKLLIEQAPDGTLRAQVHGDRCALKVEVFRAFPLSHPEEFIVLRDGKGAELGIIEDLNAVDEPTRTWLRDQLHRRYFLPRVEAIHSIVERFGSSTWDITTDRGRRVVTTGAMNEAVFEIEPGRYLITDVEGNRMELKSLKALDETSRQRFLGRM